MRIGQSGRAKRRRLIRDRERRAGEAREAEAATRQLRDELAHAHRVIAEQQARLEKVRGELIGVDEYARRIAESRAWRIGHLLMRTVRRLMLRPAMGEGAMPRLLAHTRAAQEALGAAASRAQVPPYVAATLSGAGALSTVNGAPRPTAAAGQQSAARPAHELVPPSDVREILRAEPSKDPGSVDVIVCVRDALEDVNRCLASLLERTTVPLRLIVVDDGSEGLTAAYLDRFAELNPAVDLQRNDDPPHGYTIAANIGLRASMADYVVLLNSDTIVTRGWLEHLIAAGSSDDPIGLIGPLSNAASHQSVPFVRRGGEWAVNELPDWLTADGMALLVSELPGEAVVRVPLLNGFCLCIRRRVIDSIGLFDEGRFGAGYGEENDYALRAMDVGFQLAVAARAYVHHAKSRSYGHEERKAISKQHTRRFLARHGEARVRELVADLQDNSSLRALRARVSEGLESPSRTLEHFPRLNVSFVIPGLRRGGSGGSHSVYQEVDTMRSLGVPARILVARPALRTAEALYPDADDLFTPYRDEDDLGVLTEGDDVVVATYYTSVPAVARIVATHGCLGAYYVQDYEPLFMPDATAKVEAERSYRLIPRGVLFAKTEWLCRTVAERVGVPVARVEPGLDQGLFHAEGRARSGGRVHVVAMVRTGTARRAPKETLAVLARLKETHGEKVSVTVFGCDARELKSLGPTANGFQTRGILSRAEVADLLRTADVFLDCSWYQAFGRTGLEAMACGATAVLPRVGGATEFARHGENCLLADTWEIEDAYDAVARLVDDSALRERLQLAAVETGRRYSTVKAALSEYALFCHEHRLRRQGLTPPHAQTAAPP